MKRICYFVYAAAIVFALFAFFVHRKHIEDIRTSAEDERRLLMTEHEKKIKDHCSVKDDLAERKALVVSEFLDRRNTIEQPIIHDSELLEKQLRDEDEKLCRRHPKFIRIRWNEFIRCEKDGFFGFTLRRENQEPVVALEFKDAKRNLAVEFNLYDQDGVYLGRAEYKGSAGTKRIVRKIGWVAAMVAGKLAEAYARSQGQVAMDQSQTCNIDERQNCLKNAGRWNAVADSAHKINEAVAETTIKTVADQNDGIDESGCVGFDKGLVNGMPVYCVVNVR